MELIHKKVGRGNAIKLGVTNKDTFKIEKECLQRLSKNYKCTCGLNADHFPKIICHYDIPHERGFILTDCGKDLKYFRNRIKRKRCAAFTIKNLKSQINCIVNNLKINDIQYLDLKPNGSNLCLNNKGILSLIDFDIAGLNNNFISPALKNRSNRCWFGYEDLKIKMFNMCNKLTQ